MWRVSRQVKANLSGEYSEVQVRSEIKNDDLLIFCTSERVISFQLPKFHSDPDKLSSIKDHFHLSKPQL